jgi:hypothetical protein
MNEKFKFAILILAVFILMTTALTIETYYVKPKIEKEAFLEGFHAGCVSTHLMLIEKYNFTNPTAVDDCTMLLGRETINKTWFESYKNREK